MKRKRMKIEIYPRERLELLLQKNCLEGAAIISFYDPPSKRTPREYKPVDFTSCKNPVLQIGVHDIDIEVLDEFGLCFDDYFPDADELAKFIYFAVDNELDIICQCEYGQSRSPACAAAILEHFCKNGIRVFANYNYYPNQLIFNKTLDALNKYAAEKKKNQSNGIE